MSCRFFRCSIRRPAQLPVTLSTDSSKAEKHAKTWKRQKTWLTFIEFDENLIIVTLENCSALWNSLTHVCRLSVHTSANLIFVVLLKNRRWPCTTSHFCKIDGQKEQTALWINPIFRLRIISKNLQNGALLLCIKEKSPKSSSYGKNKFRKNHLIRMEIIASKKVAKFILVKDLAPKVLTCLKGENCAWFKNGCYWRIHDNARFKPGRSFFLSNKKVTLRFFNPIPTSYGLNQPI